MAESQHSLPISSDGKPVSIVVIGMAGSGKTTFMQRINSYLHTKKTPPYVVNLDPAVRSVPFEPHIDIRDSVNYKQVMKQYNLGPNGGILTSLNLFATKIDQVLGILEKRCLPQPSTTSSTPESSSTSTNVSPSPYKHILLDTPGQIEVFVWSASGSILLSSLASSFPTVLAYVIDTPRTTLSTSTFMSNMLYAISILYKTRLPMILVFNKTDMKDPSEAIEWMRDFEKFQDALRKEEEAEVEGATGGGSGYMGSLLNSMSLVLEEFYNNLSVVGVSSMTGDGVEGFFEAVENKRKEFDSEYAPEMRRVMEVRRKEKEKEPEKEVERLMKDMGVSERGQKHEKAEPETISDVEDMSDDEDNHDVHPGHDRDSDDGHHDDTGLENGLKQRYEAALKASGNASASAKETDFAKYVQAGGVSQR